ncbi:MAG: recombinase RecT [Sulfuricaulis sp.]
MQPPAARADTSEATNAPEATFNSSRTGDRNMTTTDDPKTFQGMLKAFLPEIARALPKHMDPDRMARIALTAFRMQPKLAKCEPASVFACIIQSSQLGLEVGINGQAYLVPFWNNKKSKYECQLVPGYRGLIDLARRTSQVESVTAHIVYANDTYELLLGTEDRLTHKPILTGERGEPVFGYCIARFKDGGKHIEVMTWAEIMAIKARSKSKDKDGNLVGPWITDESEMARKTVVRRASKYWPMSVELQTAIALDDAAAAGAQSLRVKDAIEGTWTPVPDDINGEAAAEGAKERATSLQEKLNKVGTPPTDQPAAQPEAA